MSKLGVLLPLHTDQETGCTGYGEQYQLCRQAFFTKQQNGLIKEQQPVTISDDNAALQVQIDTLKSELNKIQTQQPTGVQTPQGIILNGNIIIATVFIFVIAIIATMIITKRIYAKRI